MIELIALCIALIGSSVGAMWDLKTTEIPDQIPHFMIICGLIMAIILSYQQWSYWPLLNSIIAGCSLLGFGALMYYCGQWGGGDAKILSSIGFLIPNLSIGKELLFPFPVSYLLNIFIIGAAYMIVYAFVVALLNRKIYKKFKSDMKASVNLLLITSISLFVVFIGINWYISNLLSFFDANFIIKNSLIPLFLVIGLFVIWRFAKAVEEIGFKRRIPASKLKIGDILADSKLLDGISKKEWLKIRRTKRFVSIKEGVRFAPTFPLALLYTLFFGDAIIIFINFVI